MRAFIQDSLADGTDAALDFYTSALEVLQWGNVLWKDVSPEDKGASFRESFIRGVKVLRLDAFIKVHQRQPFRHACSFSFRLHRPILGTLVRRRSILCPNSWQARKTLWARLRR